MVKAPFSLVAPTSLCGIVRFDEDYRYERLGIGGAIWPETHHGFDLSNRTLAQVGGERQISLGIVSTKQ